MRFWQPIPVSPTRSSARDTERDNYMTAEEAIKYGLIDRVIAKH